MASGASYDERIANYIQAAEELKRGNFGISIPASPADDVGRLGQALQELARTLELRYRELQNLNRLTSHINSGLLLEEILLQVYNDFRDFIPYDRVGFALLEDEGRTLRSHWAKTEYPAIYLGQDYSGEMAESSLQKILNSGKPRILNDLEKYFIQKPQSDSTRLILKEGIQSSLTCPLIANSVPVGFIFFSSLEKNTYVDQHIEIYQQIAGQLSVIVEKGRLVSELAQQKEKVEQQYQEVRRLMETQNSFMGIAAHDLRSPIASIQSVTDLLMTAEIKLQPDEKSEFLNDIRVQTRHMLGLLNDLLDVTRIEAGKLDLILISREMSHLLEETVRRNARLAAKKSTRVILEPVPPGTVLADPTRIRQVLDNLISNAVKYSPRASLVRVRALQEEKCWRVEIEDQGPGITDHDRKRIFQDFARLSARPTDGEKSTGLGLSISRRVIAAHGGEIGVDSPSKSGEGATFWFTLPTTSEGLQGCSND